MTWSDLLKPLLDFFNIFRTLKVLGCLHQWNLSHDDDFLDEVVDQVFFEQLPFVRWQVIDCGVHSSRCVNPTVLTSLSRVDITSADRSSLTLHDTLSVMRSSTRVAFGGTDASHFTLEITLSLYIATVDPSQRLLILQVHAHMLVA
jgi:hypothetical protein